MLLITRDLSARNGPEGVTLYLLDTNILIDLAGQKSSRSFFDSLLSERGLRFGTSILCVAEFLSGAQAKEERFLKNWISAGELEVIYLDSVEDAVHAAEFRRKHLLTLPDTLILASAIRTRAHLLTHDKALLNKARTFLPASDPLEEEN